MAANDGTPPVVEREDPMASEPCHDGDSEPGDELEDLVISMAKAQTGGRGKSTDRTSLSAFTDYTDYSEFGDDDESDLFDVDWEQYLQWSVVIPLAVPLLSKMLGRYGNVPFISH